MLDVLISGTLAKDPAERQSSSNHTYATAAMRVLVEDADAMLLNIIAFADHATASRLALSKRDSVAVAGRAKLSSWKREGVQHHGLSVVAENVMTLYPLTRKRKQTTGEEQRA